MAQTPFHDSIQDGSVLLQAISKHLECLSDLADLPLDPYEERTATKAVNALNAVLAGALEVVSAENDRWGLKHLD